MHSLKRQNASVPGALCNLFYNCLSVLLEKDASVRDADLSFCDGGEILNALRGSAICSEFLSFSLENIRRQEMEAKQGIKLTLTVGFAD